MSATSTSISGIVRRATFMVFVFALFLGAGTFYFFFNAASMRHVEDEARAMLRVAIAARQYTVDQLRPLLGELSDDAFHVESVPSFTVRSMFQRMAGDQNGYLYREAAINPTNPGNLATGFEEEMIRTFRSDLGETEVKGILWDTGAPVFYLARPIRIEDPACLECHSTPDRAPAAMLASYGDDNGFGWTLGEIIGVQMLTVPVRDEYRSIIEMVAVFAAMLVVLFFVVALMVTLPLQRNVIQPIRRLAEAAERSSLSNEAGKLPNEGAGEIKALSAAIDRLRTSLALSMKR